MVESVKYKTFEIMQLVSIQQTCMNYVSCIIRLDIVYMWAANYIHTYNLRTATFYNAVSS